MSILTHHQAEYQKAMDELAQQTAAEMKSQAGVLPTNVVGTIQVLPISLPSISTQSSISLALYIESINQSINGSGPYVASFPPNMQSELAAAAAAEKALTEAQEARDRLQQESRVMEERFRSLIAGVVAAAGGTGTFLSLSLSFAHAYSSRLDRL